MIKKYGYENIIFVTTQYKVQIYSKNHSNGCNWSFANMYKNSWTNFLMIFYKQLGWSSSKTFSLSTNTCDGYFFDPSPLG